MISSTNFVPSPMKTTREQALLRERELPAQPFTNYYPVGGGGRVIADPHVKPISQTAKLAYSPSEKNILA